MALLKCAACGHDVSDQAPFCPNCGQPFRRQQEEVVQTIQLTKKKWKKQSVIGLLIWLLGIFLFLKGVSGGGGASLVFGVLFGIVGFMTMLFAKIGAWWSTG